MSGTVVYRQGFLASKCLEIKNKETNYIISGDCKNSGSVRNTIAWAKWGRVHTISERIASEGLPKEVKYEQRPD